MHYANVVGTKKEADGAWFSAKQVENWSEMSKMTLWRWLERLEKARRISRFSDMKNVDMSTSTGVSEFKIWTEDFSDYKK